MAQIIAVDPGDEHVGIALWRNGILRGAVTVDNQEAMREIYQVARLREAGPSVTLVVESFVLYPWVATEQTWSPMLTAQMIGALKWEAEVGGYKFVEQGADIKKPTERQAVARGLRHMGKSRHAKDAELHLWYYCLRNAIPMDEEAK